MPQDPPSPSLLIENAPDAVFSFDREGVLLAVNPAFERMAGFARDHLIGVKLADLGLHVPLSGVVEGRIGVTPVEIQVAELPDGHGFIGAARDVGMRKVRDEQQKMEALGQMAGGVAHDFNNLLTGILGYAALLQEVASEDADVCEAAEAIQLSVGRATDLIARFLEVAGRGQYSKQPVNVNDSVRSVVRMLPRAPEVRVYEELEAASPWVMGDDDRLRQVLLNLATNAMDAMPAGGDLLFRTEQAGSHLRVTVRDTGSGIPAAIRHRIFEPFFTTKSRCLGRGLGLSVVYGIVKSHEGSIEVLSEEGRGTRVEIMLPVTIPQGS